MAKTALANALSLLSYFEYLYHVFWSVFPPAWPAKAYISCSYTILVTRTAR